jgi:hypothetical protein
MRKGKMFLSPLPEGYGAFYSQEAAGQLQANYFYIHEGIYITSGSRLEVVGSLRSVGGFHGVQAYFGVFCLSLSSLALLGGEVSDAQVGSQRDCYAISLLGSDNFSRGVMRWMVYPTPYTGLRLVAAHRGDRAYL